ncbi:MAG TPA: polyphosphate kinase 2 [Croceibacterium sp.]|nr:polyphosphate kinase 2 [Croceibacterium sp.]
MNASAAKAAKGGKGKKDRKHKAAKPEKLARKVYDEELRKLQVELCRMQEWIRANDQRVIIILEGRDTAGKSGLIRVIKERVSNRVFRVVALGSPKEDRREKLFMQRYVEQFPVAGEVVIFDRSWYNRAGVERVMGFTKPDVVEAFLENVPKFERWVTAAGIILIKLWLEIGKDEQERRFRARIDDPLRQWKLSGMDLESFPKWYDYSRARDEMLEASDHETAPWYVLPSDDKKRARLNGISHILSRVPYKTIERERPKLPKRSNKGRYDDALDANKVRFVPAKF